MESQYDLAIATFRREQELVEEQKVWRPSLLTIGGSVLCWAVLLGISFACEFPTTVYNMFTSRPDKESTMICQAVGCNKPAEYKYYVSSEGRRFACQEHMQELIAFMKRFDVPMDYISLKHELDDHIAREKLRQAGKEVVGEPGQSNVKGAQSGRAPSETCNVTEVEGAKHGDRTPD